MTAPSDHEPPYADDLAVGSTIELGNYFITRDDIIDYARRWDPLPMPSTRKLPSPLISADYSRAACTP